MSLQLRKQYDRFHETVIRCQRVLLSSLEYPDLEMPKSKNYRIFRIFLRMFMATTKDCTVSFRQLPIPNHIKMKAANGTMHLCK